jgi:murein L,D-transpeptidase YcbB/YkuD
MRSDLHTFGLRAMIMLLACSAVSLAHAEDLRYDHLTDPLYTGSTVESDAVEHPRTRQIRQSLRQGERRQEARRNFEDLTQETSALPRPALSLPLEAIAAVTPILDVNSDGEPVTLIRASVSAKLESEPFASQPLLPAQNTVVIPRDAVPLIDAAPVDLTLDPSQEKPLEGLAAIIFERTSSPEWGRHSRLKTSSREAITTFYQERRYQPLWLEGEAWSSHAQQILKTLREAHTDGLNAADYTPPLIDPLPSGDKVLERQRLLADADLRLSALVVLYASDARGARLDPSRLSAMMTPTLEIPKAADVLGHLLGARDKGAALASYHPPHEGYKRLKNKLAELRQNRPTLPIVKVPYGPTVRLGMRDERVSLIRTRFGILSLDAPEREHVYDEQVASAVGAFQKQNGLPATGQLTRATIDALAGDSVVRQESDLIATMERWRWLPQELGERHIFVNVPEFTLRMFAHQTIVHQTRVIVGKSQTPTPIFSDKVEHLVINPSWYVPPSILRKEFLPKLATDPDYAARRGFEVIRGKNGQALGVRQPPGERNALGHIKFIFPNNHAVYLHDTPTRHLFSKDARAFSHGCVRVDKPFQLAEWVMGGSEAGWSEKRLRSMVGSGERHIKVTPNLPVHIAYFTLQVSEQGEIVRFDDLYGYHRRVREVLERLNTL